ncbi:hypothetical protein K7432_003009 [Basidiobolus ranarum]|uniref:Protein YIP n=1 Tax=Basidiobolus ranarum TaxID=34480 RepID=A0ABR2W7E0_9FUNG
MSSARIPSDVSSPPLLDDDDLNVDLSTTPSLTMPSVSGNIGSGINGQANPSRTFEDTLDEPISVTIMRDLSNIQKKCKQVLLPKGRNDALKDWDLWGPLLLCLVLAIMLSLMAPAEQSASVFTGIFVIIWFGAAVVTLNAKLLGGKVSFFQSVCVLGYCVFPLDIAAIISFFVGWILVRLIFVVVAFGWSTYASIGFLSDVHLNNRRTLAVYPIFLFYFVISWMILIS